MLHVVVGVILSPLVRLDVAICGLVGGGGGLSPFSWAVFVLGLDLASRCLGGLLGVGSTFLVPWSVAFALRSFG